MVRRAVIVTGSEGGIGKELVRAFSNKEIIVIGIDKPAQARSECDIYLQVDLKSLADEKNITTSVKKEILSSVEGVELIGLINNAAVQLLGPFDELDLSEWIETLRVNVLAPVVLSRLLMDRLSIASGSIINIASIHASLTKPRFSAYAVSKAAIIGLTKSLAVEVGHKVRVLAVCPAAIETAMLRSGFERRQNQYDALIEHHPSKTIGNPGDFADLVVLLTLRADPFLNGAVVNYDGGISHRLHDPF